MNIDLHIHSTASDGTLTPLEILASARRLGLAAIAITDHDTLAGSRELLQNSPGAGIEAVSGVEISAAPPAPAETEVLPYDKTPDEKPVLQEP